MLCIGAMTRQRAVEESAVVRGHSPLLAEAVRLIGHLPIRVRGTVGGSLAHADPAAELPVVVTALNGRLVVEGPTGRRTVAATDFFISLFTTALGPSELLVEVRLPPLAPGTGTAFLEISRRAGDFALVAVAARLTLDPGGRCVAARVTVGGVGDAPAAVDLDEALGGTRAEAGALDRAAALVRSRGSSRRATSTRPRSTGRTWPACSRGARSPSRTGARPLRPRDPPARLAAPVRRPRGDDGGRDDRPGGAERPGRAKVSDRDGRRGRKVTMDWRRMERLVERHHEGAMSRREFGRRALALGASAAALPGLVSTVLGRRAEAQALRGTGEVVVCTWGGTYTESQRKAFFDPFERETGIRVRTVGTPDIAKIQAMVQNRAVEWDLVDAEGQMMLRLAAQDMLERADFSIIPQGGPPPDRGRATGASGPWPTATSLGWSTKKFRREGARHLEGLLRRGGVPGPARHVRAADAEPGVRAAGRRRARWTSSIRSTSTARSGSSSSTRPDQRLVQEHDADPDPAARGGGGPRRRYCGRMIDLKRRRGAA